MKIGMLLLLLLLLLLFVLLLRAMCTGRPTHSDLEVEMENIDIEIVKLAFKTERKQVNLLTRNNRSILSLYCNTVVDEPADHRASLE